MGAGTILLLYLRVYGGYGQMEAQGINLLFFLPVAILSIILHARNHLIGWKPAAFCILAGLPAVFLGVWLGNWLGGDTLSKLFGVMLLVIGVRELFTKKDAGNQKTQP